MQKKKARRSKKETVIVAPATSRNIDSFSAIAEELKLNNSYKSLLLGIAVVLLIGVLIGGFIKSRNEQNIKNAKEVAAAVQGPKTTDDRTVYTVVPGDDLKKISEKFFETPEPFMLIALSNGIQNPDIIEEGKQIVIPKIDKKQMLAPSLSRPLFTDPITTDSYVVQEGDVLWDIAVRAYENGYKWKDIAKINNLPTSDAIFTGMILQLPR